VEGIEIKGIGRGWSRQTGQLHNIDVIPHTTVHSQRVAMSHC